MQLFTVRLSPPRMHSDHIDARTRRVPAAPGQASATAFGSSGMGTYGLAYSESARRTNAHTDNESLLTLVAFEAL